MKGQTEMKLLARAVSVMLFSCQSSVAISAELTLVYPEKSSLRKPVSVEFKIEDEHLAARFEVRNDDVFGKEVLAPGEFPYQFDVVEVFVSVSDEPPYPYYEFELTPFEQTYQVKVPAAKTAFLGGLELGLKSRIEKTRNGWSAEMRIPLRSLGWKGDPKKIVGNAFAIFGQRPNRSFWSLFLPQQSKPNFHRPEHFKPLFP